MKRTACLCLAVLLLCGLSCACAESKQEDELFTFWDIPFGTSRLDFVEKAYEDNGFLFLPSALVEGYIFWRSFGFHENDYIFKAEPSNDEASILGYEVQRAYAAFDRETDGLRVLMFQLGGKPRHDEEICKDLARVFDELCIMYSAPSDGIFSHNKEGKTFYYDLPIQNNHLDQDALLRAFKQENGVTLVFDWRNVRLFLGFYGFIFTITDELPAPLKKEESLGYYTDVVQETVRIYDSGL